MAPQTDKIIGAGQSKFLKKWPPPFTDIRVNDGADPAMIKETLAAAKSLQWNVLNYAENSELHFVQRVRDLPNGARIMVMFDHGRHRIQMIIPPKIPQPKKKRFDESENGIMATLNQPLKKLFFEREPNASGRYFYLDFSIFTDFAGPGPSCLCGLRDNPTTGVVIFSISDDTKFRVVKYRITNATNEGFNYNNKKYRKFNFEYFTETIVRHPTGSIPVWDRADYRTVYGETVVVNFTQAWEGKFVVCSMVCWYDKTKETFDFSDLKYHIVSYLSQQYKAWIKVNGMWIDHLGNAQSSEPSPWIPSFLFHEKMWYYTTGPDMNSPNGDWALVDTTHGPKFEFVFTGQTIDMDTSPPPNYNSFLPYCTVYALYYDTSAKLCYITWVAARHEDWDWTGDAKHEHRIDEGYCWPALNNNYIGVAGHVWIVNSHCFDLTVPDSQGQEVKDRSHTIFTPTEEMKKTWEFSYQKDRTWGGTMGPNYKRLIYNNAQETVFFQPFGGGIRKRATATDHIGGIIFRKAGQQQAWEAPLFENETCGMWRDVPRQIYILDDIIYGPSDSIPPEHFAPKGKYPHGRINGGRELIVPSESLGFVAVCLVGTPNGIFFGEKLSDDIYRAYFPLMGRSRPTVKEGVGFDLPGKMQDLAYVTRSPAFDVAYYRELMSNYGIMFFRWNE